MPAHFIELWIHVGGCWAWYLSATRASWVLSKPPKCTHTSMVYSCGVYHLLYNTTLTHWSKRRPFFELHHINTHVSSVHPWANNRWWIKQSEHVLRVSYSRKFWSGKLCDKSHLHRNFPKHSTEVLEEAERHYKLILSKRGLRWASNITGSTC